MTSGTSCITDPEEEPPKQLDFGDRIELASLEVGPEGGTMEIAEGKYSRLKVVIPPNAYPTKHTVRLYASPITGNSLGENVNPRSDLITFDANGVFAAENITIQIPVDVPSGEFAMGFYYDRTTKEFEGLPMAASIDKAVTVVLRKPGEFLISSIPLGKLTGTHTSGFTPGKDDWDFINEGTARTPNGQAAGMTLSALWYYHTQTAKGQPPLWGRFNSEYDVPPKLWYDNVEGVWFATQTELSFDWKKNWASITKDVNVLKNDATRNAITYALLVTKRPQLICLGSDEKENLPFIVCKKEINDVLISDPSFQAKANRWVHVSSVRRVAYSTAFSLPNFEKQQFLMMHDCRYLGVSALIDFDKLAQSRNSVENLDLPNLQVNGVGGAVYSTGNDFYTFGEAVNITSNDASTCFYVNGDTVSGIIPLSKEITRIGVFTSSNGLWRTWQWVSIYSGSQIIALPVKDTGYIDDELIFTVKKAPNLGPEYSLVWDLGDGRPPVITSGDTLKISYKRIGNYILKVSLREETTKRMLDTSSLNVEVKSFPFTIIPASGKGIAGFPVLLSTQKRHSSNSHLLYVWRFGDGTELEVLDSNSVTHAYTAPGQYLISLKVIDQSTRALHGEATVPGSVIITPSLPNLIDSIKDYTYVSITFSGVNTYKITDRWNNGGLRSESSIINVVGGDNVANSAKRIVWSGDTFKVSWSINMSTYDTINDVALETSNQSEGVVLQGVVSSDGGQVISAGGSKSYYRSNKYYGVNSGYSYDRTSQGVSVKSLPLTTLGNGTIVYSFTGQGLKDLVTGMSYSHEDESKVYPNALFFLYKSYTSTDWSNAEVPKVTITFRK